MAADDRYYEVMVLELPISIDELKTFDGAGDDADGALLDLVDRPELFCLWLDDVVDIVAAAAPDLVPTGDASLDAEIADAVLRSAWESRPDRQRASTWHAASLLEACRS